jgi:hypothetical protein
MGIRFPKKNIAQQQAERRLKPVEPKPVKIINVPEDPGPREPEVGGPLVNKLYPEKLYRLHMDLDLLGKLSYLSEKEQREVRRRLPGSLVQAEARADKLLEKFVKSEVHRVGLQGYGAVLKRSMNNQIQLMLALRCWIAAKTVDGPRNTIKIYRNEVMSGYEFFPAESRKTMVGADGAPMMFIDYETDEDAPYKRADEVQSKRHYQVGEIRDPGPKKQDRMPKKWAVVMDEVLAGFGYQVETVEEAWKLLSKVSKSATIEERILSKIAYMVTHATIHRKVRELPGPKSI